MANGVRSTHPRIPSFWQVVRPVGAEFLFVLVPLIVLAIVYMSGERSIYAVLESPEWAFGASILFGQSVVKLVSGTSRMGATENWGTIVLIVSLVLVFGLMPSLTVLALILSKEPPSNILVIEQLVLFVVGSIAFFILGAMGHYGLFHIKD
jgi:hypothetical protein